MLWYTRLVPLFVGEMVALDMHTVAGPHHDATHVTTTGGGEDCAAETKVTTYAGIRLLLASGHRIAWVGYESESVVKVRLKHQSGHYIYVDVDLSTLPSIRGMQVVRQGEAEDGRRETPAAIWPSKGWLRTIRLASIYGINVGASCSVGLESVPAHDPNECVMGYDIEVSMSQCSNGSFPPPDSQITSMALWCGCGYVAAWTTHKHRAVPGLTYCKDSMQLARGAMGAIITHRPVWLVGYNSYKFDNCALAYHSPPEYRLYFREVASGTKSAAAHAFMIDIPGVNNVDLYAFLDKLKRPNYANLSLGSVAAHHGIGAKGAMPHTDDPSQVYSLVKYNIGDSRLTSRLWVATKSMSQLVCLCVASCAPVVDCVRYVSGTMACCAMSSYCLSQGKVMSWTARSTELPYEGGAVLDCHEGLYRNMAVVDFSSMYPTIIRDVRVSPENVRVMGRCSRAHPDRLLLSNERCTLVCVKGFIVRYGRDGSCVASDVVTTTIKKRSEFKASDPDMALSFKLLGNSLYGVFGDQYSPLYSPIAASTITLMGRMMLHLTRFVFTNLGLFVAYGDTDSNMLNGTQSVDSDLVQSVAARYFGGSFENHVTSSLQILHAILAHTPTRTLSMSLEGVYPAVLLLGKKTYAVLKGDGTVVVKGMSSTRKDRLGICRKMTAAVLGVVLRLSDVIRERKRICNALNSCFSAVLSGDLDASMVSKEVRYEGEVCYRYTSDGGVDVNIPVARANLNVPVRYDKERVYKALEGDMNRICVAAGLGTVSDMMYDADM